MADPDLQKRGGGGGWSSDPEMRGEAGLQEFFFRSFGPHFGRKTTGGGDPSPGSAIAAVNGGGGGGGGFGCQG